MPAIVRFLAPAVAAAAMPLPAFAHLGHVGELAGHSHWLGYGALVAAAAALALLPRKRRGKDEEKPAEGAAKPEEHGEQA